MKVKILVSGSNGFLGGRTAKYFATQDDNYTVFATSRSSARQSELEANKCIFKAGDLLDKEHCNAITSGVDSVVHCAALSSPWGNYTDFYNANFLATFNLLEASLRNNVKRFIFISTPGIYFNYRDRFLVKESEALPVKMVNHYATTKFLAEQLVLLQNNNGMQTISLRPRAIIGAGDTVIMPRLIRAYHSGKLKIIGKGTNICDLTCVSNVIAAIECALNADENALGKAYNISNGEPVVLWDKINKVLSELKLKPVSRKVPAVLAFIFASLLEKKYMFFRKTGEPEITKYGVGILAKSLTMDITEAEKFLNYKPLQTTDEGLMEFIEWYKTVQ